MVKSFVFIGNTDVGEILSKRLLEDGFEIAASPEEADAALVFCDSQSDLENVFFDSAGLIQISRPGTYLVNLSAATPNFSKELNAVALVSDLHPIEAPLFVKNPMLEHAFSDKNNLSCFVSGEAEDIEQLRALFEALCAEHRITASAGSAQLSHAALTILRSSQLLAGMETEALFRAFSQASDAAILAAYEWGVVKEQGIRLHSAIKNEEFTSEYSAAMWMADLTAALTTADDYELILPGAEACLHLLELLGVIGGASMSSAALSLIYSEEALCAKHGLDWTKAEDAYTEEIQDFHEDCGHEHDDFADGFGSYSAN